MSNKLRDGVVHKTVKRLECWASSVDPIAAKKIVTNALDCYTKDLAVRLVKARELLERVDAWLEDGPVEESGEISAYIDGMELVTDAELRIQIRELLKD